MPLRIAIMGRTGRLYDTARALAVLGHEISAVVAAPHAPEDDRTMADFEALARILGCPFFSGPGVLDRDETRSALQGLDLAVATNWPEPIRQEHLDRMRIGILNAHLGDLPRYGGPHCANWAILTGARSLALTLHMLEPGAPEAGRIVVRERLRLTGASYIGDIHRWASETMPQACATALERLASDPSYARDYAEPDDPDAVICYPRLPEDGRIDWMQSAEENGRLIRSCSHPFSGAFCWLEGERMVIWRAHPVGNTENYLAVPGHITAVDETSFTVVTADGKLLVEEWDCRVPVRSTMQRLSSIPPLPGMKALSGE